MRRRIATFALAVCLAGCGSTVVPSGDVALLTDGQNHIGADGQYTIGCTLMPTYGELVADPTFGVAFKDSGAAAIWPSGYTGHRVGAEVEVRNPSGDVVVVTGVGLQDIFWIGTMTGTATNLICQAHRSADHLQPSARPTAAPQ